MSSFKCFNSPSQSSEIDHGAPESIHNDHPGRSGLRFPQEGDNNVEKAVAWGRYFVKMASTSRKGKLSIRPSMNE